MLVVGAREGGGETHGDEEVGCDSADEAEANEGGEGKH